MEKRNKTSIYYNYAALRELHDVGKISDEDFEQAERDFDEKRKAAIAEYNACNGPWPYQWKNIDIVVLGILQRFGLHSLDFYDLKYLYEADNVSEIRIKGKGNNDEEQLQCIIDTIRNEYKDLLQSSEKLAITICCSSNHSAYIEKILDCINCKEYVWHEWRPTAEDKEIRLSIVTIKETSQQYKLKEWSKWTLEWYLSEVKHVGQDVAYSFYNQSDLSRVKECELMIIGINPGCGKVFSEWELKDRALSNSEFLYRGNPCFEGKSDEKIMDIFFNDYDASKRKKGWDLMRKIRKMLELSGKKTLDDLDKFVLTNMVFFGTDNQSQIPKRIDQVSCAKKTIELIDILKPKVVLLLGVKSKSLFEMASETKMIEIEAKNLSYCKRGESVVFAIKHTARFYSNAKLEDISPIICSGLDNPRYFEEIIKILPLKQLINSQGSIQRFGSNGTIVYTYWCNKNGKYEEDNGTISIGLEYDKEKNYILSILTKGNRPEKLLASVNEYCNNNVLFKRDTYENTRFIANAKAEITTVAKFVDGLLAKIKTYRDKDFPLQK